MHPTRFVFGLTALFLAMGIVVTSEQGRGGSPKPPRTTTSVKPVKTKPPSTPKTMKPASAPKVAKAAKTTPGSSAKVAKTVTAAPVKVAKTGKVAPVKVAKADKPAKTAGKGDKTVATTTTTPAATTTPGTIPLTPVQEKLEKNTNLAAKLTTRLPAGTDLMAASAGFRNLGQFVAAVNVSSNLGIPFDQLKTKMVTDGKSLGQAIQALKPVASATIEAQHAEYDARGMIADSEQQPQVSASTTTTSKTKPKAKKPAR